MEQWEEDVITTNLKNLCERTTVNKMLLALLHANGAVSHDDVNNIISSVKVREQTEKLYEIIKGKRHGYTILLSALEQTKQTSAAFILSEAKQKVQATSSIKTILTGKNEINEECDYCAKYGENAAVRENINKFDLSSFERALIEQTVDSREKHDDSKGDHNVGENEFESSKKDETGNAKLACARDPAENIFFVSCVDGLQNIIDKEKHHVVLISTLDAKLTMSKIKQTLKRARIRIKQMGPDLPLSFDSASAEEFLCQEGSKDQEPIFVFYEATLRNLDSEIYAQMKSTFYNELFQYLELQRNVKMLLVLQCTEQEIKTFISERKLDNAQVKSDRFCWNQLSFCTQTKLLKEPQMVLDRGVLRSLGHLLRLYVYEKDSHIELSSEILQGKLLVDILNNERPQIFRKTIPAVKTNYYIPRKLQARSCISPSIFESCSEHETIVVWDIRKALDQTDIVDDFTTRFDICDGVKVDLSIHQKERGRKGLSAKFILLTNREDFDEIFKMALAKDSEATLHLLTFIEETITSNDKTIVKEKFFWEQTRGASNMKSIYNNVSPEQMDLSEYTFLDEATNSNQIVEAEENKDQIKVTNNTNVNDLIIICGSPGMGKSILLANLANKTESLTQRKNSLVIFFLMTDFISSVRSRLSDKETEIPLELLKEVIYDGVSAYDLNKSWLQQSSKTISSLYLFFDGLDEIPIDYLELAYSCFQKIRKELKPVRLYITTRTNLLEQVETKLQTLAYHIQPFDDINQIDFLTKFWSSLRLARGECIQNELLSVYTKTCLKLLEDNTGEKNIGGVPLQCLLVGEVFHDEAQEFSDSNSLFTVESVKATTKIKSLTELYDRMLYTKYETFRRRYLHEKKLYREQLEQVHIYVGASNVFTNAEWQEKMGYFRYDEVGFVALKEMFNDWKEKYEEYQAGALPREGLLKVGLLEVDGNGKLQFIYRTFEDYLVAKFAATRLLNTSTPKEIKDFIEQAILSTKPAPVTISKHYNLLQVSYQFQFPVICHFLNSILSHSCDSFDKYNREKNENNEENKIIHACIQANYKHILHLYLSKISTKVRKDFLLLAARFSSSKTFKLLGYKHDLFQKDDPHPLHIAIEQGSKIMVTLLLIKHGLRKQIQGCEQSEINQLISLCINNTKGIDANSTNDRVKILERIEKICRGRISNVIKEMGMQGVFKLSPHIFIVNTLIQHVESEILMKRGDDGKTILQIAKEKLNEEENQAFLSVMVIHHKVIFHKFGVAVPQMAGEVGQVTVCADTLVVGDPDCPFNTIVLAMKNTTVFSQLDSRWEEIAGGLHTPVGLKNNWAQRKLLTTLSTTTILENILHEWRNREDEKATLIVLLDLLEGLHMKAFARSIKKALNITIVS